MPTRQEQSVIAQCSFCSKPNTEVSTLVAGPGIFICDGCIDLCARVVAGKPASVPQVAPWEQSRAGRAAEIGSWDTGSPSSTQRESRAEAKRCGSVAANSPTT